MIWIFATGDDDNYITVARGVFIRSFHEAALASCTWSGIVRTATGAKSVCTGQDAWFRRGRPPHVDTLWPAIVKTTRYRSEARFPCYPWDNVPWVLHDIEDDATRSIAYQTYGLASGQLPPTARDVASTLARHLVDRRQLKLSLIQELV